MIKRLDIEDNEAYINNLLHRDFEAKANTAQNAGKCSFGVFEDGKQIGGITARQNCDELHISLLAIDPQYQNMGYGRELLMMCEQYAKEKNCRIITVTTQDFQAPDFYEKHGYVIFAAFSDIPILGSTRYYLFKQL